jgi:hypothetical protein
MIEHRTHPKFWECYNSLPADAQRQASSAYERLVQDPFHPSIHLKAVGSYWSARAGLHYRALAVRKGDVFTWFWIGPHHEYDRLIKG